MFSLFSRVLRMISVMLWLIMVQWVLHMMWRRHSCYIKKEYLKGNLYNNNNNNNNNNVYQHIGIIVILMLHMLIMLVCNIILYILIIYNLFAIVLIVGYNQTESGEQYWIVKNSWGNKFGLDGFVVNVMSW